jgi:hypothetical protein
VAAPETAAVSGWVRACGLLHKTAAVKGGSVRVAAQSLSARGAKCRTVPLSGTCLQFAPYSAVKSRHPLRGRDDSAVCPPSPSEPPQPSIPIPLPAGFLEISAPRPAPSEPPQPSIPIPFPAVFLEISAPRAKRTTAAIHPDPLTSRFFWRSPPPRAARRAPPDRYLGGLTSWRRPFGPVSGVAALNPGPSTKRYQ